MADTETPLTAAEIETIFDDLGEADFSNRDDTIENDAIVSRINDIEAAFNEAGLDIKTLERTNGKREPSIWPDDAPQNAWDAWEELEMLRDTQNHRVEGSFIRESYFTEYAQQLTQDINGELPSWVVVDWDATAEGIKADYSAFEIDGVTYYGR